MAWEFQMCDTIPGEILMCFRDDDPAGASLRELISLGQIPHVRIIEALGDRLAALNIVLRKGLQFHFYRLGVPPGQEHFKINILHFAYRSELIKLLAKRQPVPSDILQRSDAQLQMALHSVLTLASTSSAAGVGFTFNAKTHG